MSITLIPLSLNIPSPEHCPRCGDTDLPADECEQSGDELYRKITCGNCGFSFLEVFKYNYIEILRESEVIDRKVISPLSKENAIKLASSIFTEYVDDRNKLLGSETWITLSPDWDLNIYEGGDDNLKAKLYPVINGITDRKSEIWVYDYYDNQLFERFNGKK